MKFYTSITVLIFFMCSNLLAQSAYEKAMKSNLQSLYAAREAGEFDAIANKFIRIAEAEKNKWMPYYYASLAHIWKSFRVEDSETKDELLNQAFNHLYSASAIEEQNAEILALEGFIHMLRISIDPGTRGQSITPKAFSAFGKALKLEPQNPRALLFNGQMQHGMAKFFGAGMDEACMNISLAVEAFEQSKSNDDLAPSWGRGTATEWKSKCQEKVE